jgi:Xaa-Pro aminopeptidase
VVTILVARQPHPADFPAGPIPGDFVRWAEADAAARPKRLERLRRRLTEQGIDAYFGSRPEHMRYLTGFTLRDGEDRLAGHSGRFLVSGDEVVVLADSRYRLQAQGQAAGARIEATTYDLAALWPGLVAGAGAKRVAVEAAAVSHELWDQLAKAAPEVELVPVSGWVEADRVVKEPAELERIRSACGVADRALASTLRRIEPGVCERELALALEWEIRTGGAEALAFPVACLSGPNAALPHGAPGEREVCLGEALLFDFGAMVDGYRSDMTRTLFVGQPTDRDLDVYRIVTAAQAAAIERLGAAVRGERPVPNGREVDAEARTVIEAAGHGEHFGHGTGHGIGLATHELPTLSRAGTDEPLPGPTVFSVEPGVYLDGETGVRIEDLVLFDPAAGKLEHLTRFPREVLVVGV